jgi:hypothetical protein
VRRHIDDGHCSLEPNSVSLAFSVAGCMTALQSAAYELPEGTHSAWARLHARGRGRRGIPSCVTPCTIVFWHLPSSFFQVVQAIILPWTLLALLPLACLYLLVQSYYRASSREVMCLDSITRSPVFAHLSGACIVELSARAMR